MNIWWCNQSKGWDVEYSAGVVRSSSDAKNITFRKTVGEARAGDIVVHYRRPKVVAFSCAIEDGHKTDNLPDGYGDGWEFRTKYFVLHSPLHRNQFRHQIEVPPIKGFALDSSANIRQGYFFRFNIEGLALLLSHLSERAHLPEWLHKIIEIENEVDGDINILLTEKAKYTEHRSRERNRQLTSEAKRIHGYKCQVCGFDFSKIYGDIGIGYIEAHHLVPISQLDPKQDSHLSPKKDFAVVCANCHRMLHHKPSTSVSDLRLFIKNAKRKHN